MANFLRQGSRGPEVRKLQEALNFVTSGGRTAGLQDPPLQVDGVFGPMTKARVVKFQAASQLQADGIVGPQTASALTGTVLALVSALKR